MYYLSNDFEGLSPKQSTVEVEKELTAGPWQAIEGHSFGDQYEERPIRKTSNGSVVIAGIAGAVFIPWDAEDRSRPNAYSSLAPSRWGEVISSNRTLEQAKEEVDAALRAIGIKGV